MLKKHGFSYTLMIICLVTAALMTAFLGLVSRAARERVSRQYTTPDYVRYILQGYAFDAVTNKKSLLISVTDGENLVRAHIFTIDVNKHSLDVLELPPDTLISVDGFFGTLREAHKTEVYRDIIERMLCLKIDGSASFSAKTFGDIAELLELQICIPEEIAVPRADKRIVEIDSATGERIARDGFSYSHNDKKAVMVYRTALAGILNEIYKRGSVKSFALLMNLIVNRVDTDMTVSEMIELANCARGIKPSRIRLHIATGSPASYNGERVWALHAEAVAELLNENFRVYGVSYPAEVLEIPKVTESVFLYGDLAKSVTEILP